MRKKAKGGSIAPSKMGSLPQGNKAFGQHADQKSGMTRGKNLGDAGKEMPIQKEVKMAKGGKTKRMFAGGLDTAVADEEGPRRSPANTRLVSPEAQTASGGANYPARTGGTPVDTQGSGLPATQRGRSVAVRGASGSGGDFDGGRNARLVGASVPKTPSMLGRAGGAAGLATYSKDAGEADESLQAELNRREGRNPSNYDDILAPSDKKTLTNSAMSRMKAAPKTAPKAAPKTTSKAIAVKKAMPAKKPRETATSRANRLAAYEDWVKTVHDPYVKRLAAYEARVKADREPMTKDYLKTGTSDAYSDGDTSSDSDGDTSSDNDADSDGDTSSDNDADGMKKGGKVKGKTCMRTGGLSRGDGAAQRGKTRGRYC